MCSSKPLKEFESMARTIRALNAESSIGKQAGSKITGSGYFTEYDIVKREKVYRKPTKKEYFEAWYMLHGDSDKNHRTPSRDFRKNREKQLRMINKSELNKYKRNSGYDMICESTPRSHLWDWR
jgi:SLT domain-containing protein